MLAAAYAQHPEMDSSCTSKITDKGTNSRRGARYRHMKTASRLANIYLRLKEDAYAFDVCRALLLISWQQFGTDDTVDSYLTKSCAIRVCIALGLHQDDIDREADVSYSLHHVPNRGRINANIDLEERRITMSLAFASDRGAMFATMFPGNIVEEDYTASLPRFTLAGFLRGSFDESTYSQEPLFIQSLDLFSREVLDAQELETKGTVLLGRCAQFIFRHPRGRDRSSFSAQPMFKQLESHIASLSHMTRTVADRMQGNKSNSVNSALFQFLTSPANIKSIYRNQMIVSTLIPYACVLTLHEPLANHNAESESACFAACRNSVSVLKVSNCGLLLGGRVKRCQTDLDSSIPFTQFCSLNAEEEMARFVGLLTHIVGMIGKSLVRQLNLLCSRSISQAVSEVESHHSWDFVDFSDSINLLRADLDVILSLLDFNGQKFPVALGQRQSLLKLLEFSPHHRFRNLFTVK